MAFGWLPDSNWLKALEIKGSVAIAFCLACFTIVALAEWDVRYLKELPPAIRTIFVVAGILSGAIGLARIWDFASDFIIARRKRRSEDEERAQSEQQVEERRHDREAQTLAYLDTLNNREREILSYLVQSNEQSFTSDMTGGHAATLVAKGLVEMAGGVHSQMDWPFIVPNFVWQELQRRNEYFNTAGLSKPRPWRIRYY